MQGVNKYYKPGEADLAALLAGNDILETFIDVPETVEAIKTAIKNKTLPIEIINDKMLMVETGGVQFPVYMDQVDFPYLRRFMNKKTEPQHKTRQFIDDLKKIN